MRFVAFAAAVLTPCDSAVLSSGTLVGSALILVIVVNKRSGKWMVVGHQEPSPRPFLLFQAVSVRTRCTWMGFSASCAIARPSTSHCWLPLER